MMYNSALPLLCFFVLRGTPATETQRKYLFRSREILCGGVLISLTLWIFLCLWGK